MYGGRIPQNIPATVPPEPSTVDYCCHSRRICPWRLGKAATRNCARRSLACCCHSEERSDEESAPGDWRGRGSSKDESRSLAALGMTKGDAGLNKRGC